MKKWLLILALPTLLVVYQNCAPGFESAKSSGIDQSSGLSDTDFFMYPYSAKPEFMGELGIEDIQSVDAQTNRLKIEGVVVNVDQNEVPVVYEVRWYGANGAEVCPALTAATSATRTTISYDCLANKANALAKGRLMAYSHTERRMILVREINL